MLSIPGYHIMEQPGGGPLYEGKNSIIYSGIRQSDDRNVVLKLLKEEDPKRNEVAKFRNEYEMTHSLQIEGTIEVYGLESHQNQWVMVLEDFEGISLSNQIRFHTNPISPMSFYYGWEIEDFLKMAIQLTEILGKLHQQNIMHKDINPSNILYNAQTKQVKLIDFGISTSLSKEIPSVLPPTVLEGTLPYMSPEQTGRMNRAMDYRTDFYSLGVTFYELLTGQLPFQAQDALELVHCHLAKLPTSPNLLNAAIPNFLSEIILKLMAKHSEDRYQSAYGLKADLEACLTQLHTFPPPESFHLGRHDISDRFQIPQKLYGREKEIDILLKSFERVSRTSGDGANGLQRAKEMVMVAGYAGIGKSTLVHELHKPIVEKQGYFISGKFDQFNRDVPFVCLIEAFQRLIRQLLGESESQIIAWREKLLEALGANGRVLTEVIPELEFIIGPQPPSTHLPRLETQNRFNLVFQKFIRALSTHNRPLTIFLDDLQWADPASLRLLDLIMSNNEIQGLLLIGAYRDNETGDPALQGRHVLISTLKSIRESGTPLQTIHLLPLPLEKTRQLVADTFQCSQEDAQDLAHICFIKTQGNPFFLAQFLHSLYADGLVMFDSDQQKWRWQLEAIHHAKITDNVVELMAGKIQKLPQSTQQIFQWAACLSNTFELNTLALILEKSPEETFALLWETMQEGLILSDHRYVSKADEFVKFGSRFKFSHDRIQESAYSLIEDTQKASFHLKIGRLLLRHTAPEDLEENPFDVVNHCNKARPLFESQSERKQLAELNLKAGSKAKKNLAYSAAVDYLKAGIALLEMGSTAKKTWLAEPSLFFTLHVELAEAHYLNTDFEAADQLYPFLLKKAQSSEDKYAVYTIQLEQLTVTGKFFESIEVAKQALKTLGIFAPDTIAEASRFIEQEIVNFPSYMAGRKVAELALEDKHSGKEEEQQLILLSSLSTSALITSQGQLVNWSNLKGAVLCLQNGPNEIASFSYTNYAYTVLGGLLKDYNNAYEYGKMAVTLSDRHQNLSYQGRTYYVFATFINPLKNPLSGSCDLLRKAIRLCTESGDFVYAGYAIGMLPIYQIISGQTLPKIHDELEKYIPFMKRTNDAYFEQWLRPIVLQVLKHLHGHTLPGTFSDPETISDAKVEGSSSPESNAYFNETDFLKTNQNPMVLAQYYSAKIRSLALFGQFEEALQYLDKVETVVQALPCTVIAGDAYFYMALTLTAVLTKRLPRKKEVGYHKALEMYQNEMKTWSAHAPANYEHKVLLIEAEMAKLDGQLSDAIGFYKQGIASAKKAGFLQMEAVGNELYSRFWIENDEFEFARHYLQKAYRLYQHWGATAKLAQLENHYSWFRASQITEFTDAPETANSLDLDTIIKASQALSQEINLEKLLESLMRVIIENAGAQKGLLLLKKEGTLLIEGMIDATTNEVRIQQNPPREWQLPLSIARFVARTGESVRINEASGWKDFSQDPYFTASHPQAILCIPLKQNERIDGVLYLDNEITGGVFTEDRIQMLEILLAQTTISIDNARLYQDLEERVRERTESIQNFYHFISHELRTPIAAIEPYIRFLKRGMKCDPPTLSQLEHLNIIDDNMQRVLKLSNQILDRARIESQNANITLEPCLIHPLIERSFEQLQGLFKPTVKVSLELLAPQQPVLAIRDDLETVLKNLMSNAAKYTERGIVRINTEQNDQGVQLSIQDTGIGIESENVDLIFEQFTRLDHQQPSKGVGLGLNITQILVKRMGGKIGVTSQKGEGSTFWVWLPLA